MPTKYYINGIDHDFVSVIHKKRKSLGVSALALSNRLGALGFPMHRVRISKWENGCGGKVPTLGEALALAHVLDVDMDAFLESCAAKKLQQKDLDTAYRGILRGAGPCGNYLDN